MAPNENHYDTNRYAGDQAADTRRVMNHMPDEDRVPMSDLQQSINKRQAEELADGVRMGDDRVIGDTPNWESFDSEQLYTFATENNSPYTADDLGRAFNDGGNGLAEAANGLFEAVSRLDGAWTGVAADSAKSALKPLAKAAGTAGQTAQLMGVRMSQQSVAASEVAKLPPPKTFDQQQSLDAMLAGGPEAMQQDLKAQKDAAEAVKKEQISYLNAYTKSMSAVDAQTPSFVPPPETGGGGGGNNNNISGERVNVGPVGNNTAWNPNGSTSAGPSQQYTGAHGPGGNHPGFGDPNGDGQTDQSSYTPLPGFNTGSSQFTPQTAPPGPSTFGPGGGGGLPSSGNVPGAGSGGFGGGFGSFGNQGGAGASGPGAGSGAGSGNPAGRGMPGGGMGPGGAGRPGAGGPPGGMGGAGRKGEGEEDKEHGRPSYLVEGDPESTFGSDELTAPPVIGDDS
jgi:hypothetical protein